MRQLLPARAELIQQLAWSRALIGLDFDGTLAPIVADRESAAMRKSTFDLFTRLCKLFPVAVISGRSRADVRSRLKGASPKYVIGNHGLEPGASSAETEAGLTEARVQLSQVVARLSGLDLEDKRYSLAVHYRRSRQKKVAQAAVLAAVGELELPMRVIPGKCVLNVVPASAPNKGDALLSLRERARADVALYVGDDVTDEDVFRLDQPGRLLTVRVGRSQTSAATYFLRNQLEIDALLRRLITARESSAR